MKKILIISYYFPPCNSIAANRPKSFADNFKKFGLFPIVLTRHWTGNENHWADFQQPSENRNIDISENEDFRLIKVPYDGKLNIFSQSIRSNGLRKTYFSYLALRGIFHIEVNAYECLKEAAENILKADDIDAILVSSPPLNIVKLGSELARKFNKPLIADFRDLWNNELLSENYEPTLKTNIYDKIYEFYLKKWLQNASLITSVSQPLIDELARLNNKCEKLVITNGFELGLFKDVKPYTSSKFNFSVIGTLYPKQDLSILINGLNAFLKDKNFYEIELNFIGTGAISESKDLLESSLPKQITHITNKVPRQEAIRRLIGADVLFHAGWKGFRGIASGKIFEYLGSKRNILIAPGDNDIIERLVNETNAGKIANSTTEFVEILNEWFAEWRLNGKILYKGIISKIEVYSRENQALLLASAVNEIISESNN